MSSQRTKLEFNSNTTTHAGLLESPLHEIKAYALFAHCFTCGKDITAASRIARALVRQGYGVLRFDFTGLGNSDGDFANTNFSSNVQDLAAKHPKSFISLDNADHLLTKSSDAEYVAVCISAWASKFLLPDSTTPT